MKNFGRLFAKLAMTNHMQLHTILGGEEKGQIRINYYSNDDLQRIYDLIDSLRR